MNTDTTSKNAHLLAFARELLSSLRLPPLESPKNAIHGKMRGVDFYGQRFPVVLVENLKVFYEHYERLPVHPRECETLNEKLFWSKFFTPLDIPSPANKLLTGKFIPEHLHGKVRPAKVHWISDSPDIPEHLNIPAGSYYLKANNSWRTVKRVQFPMSAGELRHLRKLSSLWLEKTNFNLMGGEWWYSTILPKIYIEEDVVGAEESSREYKIQCVNGDVACIFEEHYVAGSDRKEYEGVTIYDANFDWVDGVEIGEMKNIKSSAPTDAKLLLEIARELSKPFDAIRVDLYNPAPGKIILGELTICDAAGFAEFEPRSFDVKLGAGWDFTKYFA